MIQRRVSASSLKTLSECTMKYYLSRVEMLPEKTWPRTHAGSASHSVLEALYSEKHRHHYEAVKNAGSIYASPAIQRLVNVWQWKTKMEDSIVADIDGMCMVAINETNFLDEGATKRFEPEHEFRLTLKNGGTVKGFIDRLAEYGDQFVIWDYKTQRDKFTNEEVLNNFQSLVYQLYVWRTFGKMAEVRYLMLRHAPTKRFPNRHLQVTPPATPAQLEGFSIYLEHMHNVMNNFGLEEAQLKYHEDRGFCDRVCSYRKSFPYVRVTKVKTGELVGKYFLDFCPQIKDDELAERCTFKGCLRFNPQSL